MTVTVVGVRPCFLYFLYDGEDRLLYVGMTDDPATRFKAHAGTKPWWGDVAREWVQAYPDRTSCAAAEALAIHSLTPTHNVAVPTAERCGVLMDRAETERPSELELICEVDALRAQLQEAESRIAVLERAKVVLQERVVARDERAVRLRDRIRQMRNAALHIAHEIPTAVKYAQVRERTPAERQLAWFSADRLDDLLAVWDFEETPCSPELVGLEEYTARVTKIVNEACWSLQRSVGEWPR